MIGLLRSLWKRIADQRRDDDRLIAEAEDLNAHQRKLIVATDRLLRDPSATIEQMMADVVNGTRRTEDGHVRRMD